MQHENPLKNVPYRRHHHDFLSLLVFFCVVCVCMCVALLADVTLHNFIVKYIWFKKHLTQLFNYLFIYFHHNFVGFCMCNVICVSYKVFFSSSPPNRKNLRFRMKIPGYWGFVFGWVCVGYADAKISEKYLSFTEFRHSILVFSSFMHMHVHWALSHTTYFALSNHFFCAF